jgi:Protein of unknown function (DUF2934)
MTNEVGQSQAIDKGRENPPGDELDRKIRRRTYQIWTEEGKSAGRDKDHWIRAKAEVLAMEP